MTWETVWNISKLIGLILGMASVITLLAKVWSNARHDRYTGMLEKEMEIYRQRVEAADRDVKHYRDEMHDVRKECQGKITATEADLLFAREKLKAVEIENARLLSQTDLSPVTAGLTQILTEHRKFTVEQTAINAKVLEALQRLLDHPIMNGHDK